MDNSNEYESNLKKDTLKYLPVKILPALAGLLTIYCLTKTLSTNLYASYSFVTASILLFGQLVSGWINSSIMFFFPDFANESKLERLKINVVGLQLILFFLGAIAFSITCYFGIDDYAITFLGVLLLMAQTFLNLLYSFLQSERRVLVQIKATTIQAVIQIAGVLICFYFYKENLRMIILLLFVSFFITVLYVMYCDKIFALLFNKAFFSQIDWTVAKKVLAYGLPVCVWFFAAQFYVVGDRILLKFFNISHLVGNYSSFRDLAVGLSGFITMPLLMASHPIIMQMHKSQASKNDIENIVVGNVKLLSTLFSICFIILILLGDWIFTQIVGTKYLLPNDLMLCVLGSIFLATLSMYLHKGLEVTGNTGVMLKVALAIAILSLVSNCLLLPNYGVTAACLISVFCQVAYCAGVYYFSRLTFKIRVRYNFILKHISLVVAAYLLSVFLISNYDSLLLRFIIVLPLIIYLFLTSKEVSSMLNLIRKR
ncbi:oligosaccharide flippase family protein [Pedobacter frigiditerrae]|uniref:oligosaccharide flippase family protein n=1 Tax=Pedobacter frigiditerrae TaxID=2530452 RepID=UPI002930E9E2|nr:oligosaccharide flippase family protein [Pedobacter frigiditerrae]